MAITSELGAACVTAGISEAFGTFLAAQGILTMVDFGILAKKEEEVGKEIIDVAVAANVKIELKDKASIKKLWMVCRAVVDAKSGATPSNPDAPLSDDDAKELKAVWSKAHGFVLPEDWCLAPLLLGKLGREVNSGPPIIEVILAERIRMRSSGEKTEGALLHVVPGRA